MRLQDILSEKGTAVHSIRTDATLQDVVAKLIDLRIGALVICQPDAAGIERLVGIITDRDILYASAHGQRPLHEVRVSEVMTTELITGTPEDEIGHAMGLMTYRRIRHLPIVVDGRLSGIVSIGDLVKAQHDRLAVENRFMKDYISG
jgi:CBS domain-containing protein